MGPLFKPLVYRQVDGEWVAYGTPQSGIVAGVKTVTVQRKDGTTEVRTVTRVEQAPVVEGIAYSYAYLEPRPGPDRPRRRAYRSRSKGCISGGNCSSFNDGRSCGADDCDGW